MTITLMRGQRYMANLSHPTRAGTIQPTGILFELDAHGKQDRFGIWTGDETVELYLDTHDEIFKVPASSIQTTATVHREPFVHPDYPHKYRVLLPDGEWVALMDGRQYLDVQSEAEKIAAVFNLGTLGEQVRAMELNRRAYFKTETVNLLKRGHTVHLRGSDRTLQVGQVSRTLVSPACNARFYDEDTASKARVIILSLGYPTEITCRRCQKLCLKAYLST